MTDTPMTQKLKPCPFCGEEEELYPAHRGWGGGAPYAIDCVGCGIDFTPREGMDVVESWNRRAGEDDLTAIIEAYEAALREAEAIFGGEYADHHGPMFDLAMNARARRQQLSRVRSAPDRGA